MHNDAIRDFYNEVMPQKFGDDYEYKRWFSTPIQKAGYELTRRAIEQHVLLLPRDPSRILELGPGAGTWTKLLVAKYPNASIDLLDISKEMLQRARKAVGQRENVRTFESDILDWTPDGTYDLFFSSRVLEYVSDKRAFVEKVHALLTPGGEGFLITKMPHYAREKVMGRKLGAMHQGQIAPHELVRLLKAAGFIDVSVYPVTMSIPLFRSPRLNVMAGSYFGRRAAGLMAELFAESYGVLFRRPHNHP